MATSTAEPGRDLVISIGGTALLGDEECTINKSQAVQKLPTTKGSPRHPGYLSGEVETTISGNGLMTLTDTALQAIENAIDAGSVLSVAYTTATGAKTASALAASLQLSQPTQGGSTYSYSLTIYNEA